MGIGYTRQSSADIVDGLPITAAPLNNEFNALRDAFGQTDGHSHDGTSGEGPKLDVNESTLGTLPVNRGGTGATTVATARNNLGAAPLDSPSFTGTPLAPTAAAGTNTTQLATTAFVTTAAGNATDSVHRTRTDNPHNTTKSQVGLSNVDNTSDANKPVSTATQAALDTKVNRAGDNMTGGLILPASTSSLVPLNIPHGATPSSLTNGDLWTTTSGILFRRNGVTRTLLDNTANSISNTLLASMPANTVKGQLSSAGGPSDLTLSQLLAGFGAFINGSPNGYTRIPLIDGNGAIVNFFIQWGLANGSGDIQITFPVAFPNSVFSFGSTPDSQGTVPGATTAYADFIRQVQTTGMVVCKRSITGSGPNTHNLLSRWFAIGY